MQKICVCGAGTMGSGIAQVAATAGFSVVLFDTNENMLLKSKALLDKNLDYLLSGNKISHGKKIRIVENILFTAHKDDCVGGIIIEAIIEDKNAKAALFNSLATINKADTIFATNTSSISVSEIAEQTNFASQIIGMHFFNPPQIMKLVEIVKGNKTAETIVQQVFQLAKDFGKIPVVCKDAPGFIVNRVARQYYLEPMKMVKDGLTNIETIDAIMEANGFKMGPFKLMDLIGLDVNFSVSNIVYEALGKPERLKPSLLQKEKVYAKELGRKSGKGFYQY